MFLVRNDIGDQGSVRLFNILCSKVQNSVKFWPFKYLTIYGGWPPALPLPHQWLHSCNGHTESWNKTKQDVHNNSLIPNQRLMSFKFTSSVHFLKKNKFISYYSMKSVLFEYFNTVLNTPLCIIELSTWTYTAFHRTSLQKYSLEVLL